MKQYFIGFNKRSERLLIGLMSIGGTLMFYYHPKTLKLNNKFKFYDGEWMLYTDIFPDSGITGIRTFLEKESKLDPELKYEIVNYQDI